MKSWALLRREHVGAYDHEMVPPKVAIPALPVALTSFLKLCEDPDASPASLAKAIERDAGFTCDLLRFVNSSTMALREKVATAQRAITVLGIHRSKMLLIASATQQALKPKGKSAIDFQTFTHVNLQRAYFSKNLSRIMGRDEDLAFAASLLADCLLPMLAGELQPTYDSFSRLPNTSRMRLDEFEQSKLGWSHPTGVAQLMLGWGFPDELVCCVYFHHRLRDVLSSADLSATEALPVAISCLLPDLLSQAPGGLNVLKAIASRNQAFDLLAIAQSIDEEMTGVVPPKSTWRSLSEILAPAFCEAAPAGT